MHSLLCLVICPCWLWQPSEHFSIRYVNIVTIQHVSYLILFVWVVGTSLASLRLCNDKIFLVVMVLVVGIFRRCRCWFIWKFFASLDFKFRPRARERSSMHVMVLTCSKFQKDSSQRFSDSLLYSPLLYSTVYHVTSNEDKIDSASWKKADR